MNRRHFLQTLAGSAALSTLPSFAGTPETSGKDDDAKLRELIEAHRPSRLKNLPANFNARVGATHVGGKYHLTSKPFLIEGAEKLLELGTRLGKFWFIPDSIARDYPFNSKWSEYRTLVELAKSDYHEQLFALPFETILLEAHTNGDHAAREPKPSAAALENVTHEFYELTAHFYKRLRDRAVTVILQNWEGDWIVRGLGEKWNPPPADAKARCERAIPWFTARQAGVSQARMEFGKGARCRVAHAIEVNRVVDLWHGIPTLTEHVLPQVEVDLVSYSCYDAMTEPLTLYKAVAEIRKHSRTGPLFGKGAVFAGEMGIPENTHDVRTLADGWDRYLGALLAADALYMVQWEVYCNELKRTIKPPPAVPVKKWEEVQGFGLVKPDGELSEVGKYFTSLWKRARKES